MSNVIHQAFHGYNNGHTLISSSVELTSNTKSILLIESDSPGDGFHYQESPCYSGYPITESGFYVISKTWVAKEISRPGCVWTHSLLIPFSVLSKREGLSPHYLESLFSSRKKVEEYQSLKPINLTPNVTLCDEKNLSSLFSKIFINNEQINLNSAEVSFIDIIFVWRKLWPKMRREFSFKTWAPKKTRTSSSFDKFDLILNDFALPRDVNDNWAEDFFIEDSSIHDFNWKYGASLAAGKGGVFELYTAWVLFSNNSDDELVKYLLSWKKAPVSLVKDVIAKSSPNSLSLTLSYLISKYILTLEEKDISNDLVAKVGDVISRNDIKFFKKVVESDFFFKKQFYSMGINNLSGPDAAELINNGNIDYKSINKDTWSYHNFWKNLSTSLKLNFVKGFDSYNDIPPEILGDLFKNIDKVKIDESLLVYIIMSNFDVNRYSHKEKISNSKNKILEFISKGFPYHSKSLYDFIYENYSAYELTVLNDESLSNLYLYSSGRYINILKLAEVLCCDNNLARVKTLDIVFDETYKRLSNYQLSYSDKSKAINLFQGYLDLNITGTSLLETLINFVEKYALNHNIKLSEKILDKVNSYEKQKKDKKGKKNSSVFWFLDF